MTIQLFSLGLFYLMALHWLADFVLQSHWMATNKSKNNVALLAHVGTYTFVLFIGSILIMGLTTAVVFVTVNGLFHLMTDYITSRWSSALYAKNDYHNFFVVIGLDQYLHFAILLSTFMLVATAP